MGRLNIMNATGHVEINWSSDSIHVNLNPSEGNANKHERKQVARMIDQAVASNFEVTVDGKPVNGMTPDLKKASVVDFTLLAESMVKNLIGGVIRSDVTSHHLLFKVGRFGKGQLIQKSDFEVDVEDTAEYASTPALAGG
jgi:hypothetical protein